MIRAEHIVRKFGSVSVLNDVSVELKRNELVSIIGASGAGKSTLLHILGTLDRPDSGSVYLDNINVLTLNSKNLAKVRNTKIGFVFQFHNLLAELTALENICLPAMISGLTLEQASPKAEELMETLGILHRKDHLPSQMSGGEMQRVAVGRALINSPEMVFADEPSGNLDAQNASMLHEMFFELKNKYGFGVVIVTHNPFLAKQSDIVYELNSGLIHQVK